MRRLDLEQLGPKKNSCQMLWVFAPICCGAGIHVCFFWCWFCISNSTANVIDILRIIYVLYLFYNRFIVMLCRALEFWYFFGVLSTSWEVCNTAYSKLRRFIRLYILVVSTSQTNAKIPLPHRATSQPSWFVCGWNAEKWEVETIDKSPWKLPPKATETP